MKIASEIINQASVSIRKYIPDRIGPYNTNISVIINCEDEEKSCVEDTFALFRDTNDGAV